MNVHGQKIWIVGAARSGIAAARLLKNHGADLFVTDANSIESEQKTILQELKIPYEEGGHSTDRLLKEAQLVVLSPSIPLDKPLPLAVREAGIPLVSEIEVSSWFFPKGAVVVGITGTNGKSTTTHYTAQLFNAAGRNAVACGNIGRPLADALLDSAGYDAFIVELSSYQLETTLSLRPQASVLLNLQNDHLARYGSMEEYLKAKWRLVLLTQENGIAVVDEAVLKRALSAGLPMPSCSLAVLKSEPQSGTDPKLSSGAATALKIPSCPPELYRALPQSSYGKLTDLPLIRTLEPSGLSFIELSTGSAGAESVSFLHRSVDVRSSETELSIAKSCLDGFHNQLNIAAASAAAAHLGIDEKVILKQWNAQTSAYQHLPHRLEDICKGALLQSSDGQTKRIRAINDSKATNVESTIVAVKSFSCSIRLLLGGEPKGDLYSELIPFIGKNICRIYPFGKAAPLICSQLAGENRFLASPSPTMTDAAQKALEDSQDGDIILLSPACASFDEFRNFEHRGDVFRQWVTGRVIS
jgi:UDP-N-acetylmuramoylalanine--D-glutamate ligase